MGVAKSQKLEGVMHVNGMAPYCFMIFEVPRGLMEGIHCVMSRNLVCGTHVVVVGEACDVTGVLDVLPKMHDNVSVTTIRIDCFILGSLTQQYSMRFTELWVISKTPFPKKVFLPVPATCSQSLDRRTVNSKCLCGSRP